MPDESKPTAHDPASPAGQRRAVLVRDLPVIAIRGATLVAAASVGGQLVQALGGTELHVAALRSAWAIGLLLSLGYARLGRRRSPLQLIFWPEAAAMFSIATLGTLALDDPGAATRFTVTVCVANALLALTLPHLATIYGLAYSPEHRTRLVAYGRMVNGIVAAVAGFGFGRLFQRHPESLRIWFPALAAAGLVAAYHFYRMPVAVARSAPAAERRSAWRVLREDKMFARFQAFQFLLGFANLASIPVLDVFVRRELGFGIDLAVLVVAKGVIMQLVMLFTVRAQSRLFDRIGVVKHRVFTSMLMAAGYTVWAFTDGMAFAMLAAGLIGLGMAGGQLIWMIGSLEFANRADLTTYSGIHTFLTGLRGVLAPGLGVWFLTRYLDGDYRTFFLIASTLMTISAVGHALTVHLPPRRQAAP